MDVTGAAAARRTADAVRVVVAGVLFDPSIVLRRESVAKTAATGDEESNEAEVDADTDAAVAVRVVVACFS